MVCFTYRVSLFFGGGGERQSGIVDAAIEDQFVTTSKFFYGPTCEVPIKVKIIWFQRFNYMYP